MEEQGFEYCPVCGAQIVKEIITCPQCGSYIPKSSPTRQDYSNEDRMNYEPVPNSNNKVGLGLLFVVIAIVILSVLAGAIIGPMLNTTEDGDDGPYVVRTDPADGATDVEPVFSLKIFFSEPMTRSTTLHYDFWQYVTEQTETMWIDDQTAEIINLRFQMFGTITIRFHGDHDLRDSDGNWLAEDYEWTFTTRPPKVEILSTTTFRDPDDNEFIFIYGELRNDEEFNMSFEDFEVKGYDVNNNYVGTSYFSSRTAPYVVESGEVISYMSYYRDAIEVVEEIVVEITNDAYIEPLKRYDGLEIINDISYFEVFENNTFYTVNGTIINNGPSFADHITVAATYYDSEGSVVAVSDYSVEPRELNVTETLDFEIGVYEGECDVLNIMGYKIMAYGLF